VARVSFERITPAATRTIAASPAQTTNATRPEIVSAPITAVAAAGECDVRVANMAPSARPPAMAAAHSEWLNVPTRTPTNAEITCPPITLRGCESGSVGAPATRAMLAAMGGMRST